MATRSSSSLRQTRPMLRYTKSSVSILCETSRRLQRQPARPLVLEVHPAFSPSSLTEFISYAKANPGKITLASFGTATVSHLAGELFKAMAGINLLHVPYRGTAPMLSDLLGGQVQASFDNLAGSIEFIKLRKLRPL